LRSLLSARIVGSVLRDLATCDKQAVPQEPMVECICELLQNIGFTLEQCGAAGKEALDSVCSRLAELKERPSEGDRAGMLYSKRIQFAIQDVLETRSNSWRRKTFKASAKTKMEIAQEQYRDIVTGGVANDGSEIQIAGARRNMLGAF